MFENFEQSMPAAKEAHKDSSFGNTLEVFGKSAFDAAIQSPYNGIAQIAHLPEMNVAKVQPEGTAENAAAVIGSGIGMIAPVMLVHKGVGRAMGENAAKVKTAELIGDRTIKASIGRSSLQGALTGGIYGGVLTPGEEGLNWTDRMKHAASHATMFGVLSGGTKAAQFGLEKFGIDNSMHRADFLKKALPARIASGAAVGGIAGAAGSEVDALTHGKLAPDSRDLLISAGSMAALGGAFGGAEAGLIRATKGAKITEEQMKDIEFAKPTDKAGKDWQRVYEREFPADERQNNDIIRQLLKDGDMILNETRGKNGKLLSWTITEPYPARDGINETPFWLGCWTASRADAQSLGLGGKHFRETVKELRDLRPEYMGRMTEIEATKGLPADSQPVRRENFYANPRMGLKQVDMPYDIPLFQPEGARAYVNQRDIGEPIAGKMLWTPFAKPELSGRDLKSVIERVYTNGYGITEKDPYLHDRLAIIDESKQNYLSSIKVGS